MAIKMQHDDVSKVFGCCSPTAFPVRNGGTFSGSTIFSLTHLAPTLTCVPIGHGHVGDPSGEWPLPTPTSQLKLLFVVDSTCAQCVDSRRMCK